jgi:polar amino acid transport system substrate-binding protein
MTSTLRFLVRLAIGLASVALVSAACAQATYNVGATVTGGPFKFFDIKTNSIQGLMVESATAIGQANRFKVMVQQTRFSALLPSLTANKIDIISAGMLKTPTRAEVVDSSQPVYSHGEGLIVKANDAKSYASLVETSTAQQLLSSPRHAPT